jgi:hypothetical protein
LGPSFIEYLDQRKLSAKWIPKCLNVDQERQRCQSSEKLLKFFRRDPDRPWGPPSLLHNGYRVYPGGRKRPGRGADPPSSAEVHKQTRAIPLFPLRAFVAYKKGETYLPTFRMPVFRDVPLVRGSEVFKPAKQRYNSVVETSNVVVTSFLI